MIFRSLLTILAIVILAACYQPQRDCERFRTGTFTFTSEIDGEEVTTTFVRNDSMEIDYFQGRQDTATVRWINDCEYIVEPLSSGGTEAGGALHMKILSTTDNSYTFEYSLIGRSQKSRGTAIKSN